MNGGILPPMSMKSGLRAAQRQGVQTTSINMGSRGGKWYTNSKGNKVYGTAPTGRAARTAAGTNSRKRAADRASGSTNLRRKATRAQWSARPNRESLSKRLGKVARQIRARDNNTCVYCKKKEPRNGKPVNRHQLDHLKPRVKGGQDVATNLVVACKPCNGARKEMSLAGWAAYAKVKFGAKFDPKAILAQARKPLPEV